MRTLEELLRELSVSSATDVLVYKQPAIGVSASMQAARRMAEEISRNPWVARSQGTIMSVTSGEAEVLRGAGAYEPTPGNRVIASWLWLVINPQLDHCQYESKLLERTLTFRQHNRDFERLYPLRNALVGDGQRVYDDMLGEMPEYDAIVQLHDDTLSEVRICARAVFDVLLDNSQFASVMNREIDKISAAEGRTIDRSRWLRYLAAHVVNDNLASLSAQDSEVAALWNQIAEELKQLVPQGVAMKLREARDRFGDAVLETRRRLLLFRRELSRQYNIPVAPIPGIAIEATVD